MKYKLICFDMDGVIFKFSNSWIQVHKVLGTFEEGKKLTDKYLKKDYNKLVEEVVHKLWKGKNAAPISALINDVEYVEGVKETFSYLQNEGMITAIISSGIMDMAKKAQHDLFIDHVFANELVIKKNIITGEFIWPVGSGIEEKPRIIKKLVEQLKIKLDEVVFVGDGIVDVKALKMVGLGIAFNTDKKEVIDAADVHVKGKNLKAILKELN
jgi:phosphoserine phosphatase